MNVTLDVWSMVVGVFLGAALLALVALIGANAEGKR